MPAEPDLLVSPMNWKPASPDDLIGQAKRVVKAQVAKARRLAAADSPTGSMKLLLYGLNYAPEPVGIGKYSGELAEWLAGRGHEVRVITAPPYFPQWRAIANRYRREQRRGVSIWRCPLWVPRRPSGVSRLIHLASFALPRYVQDAI